VRLLIIAALVCAILAVICAAVPTTVLGMAAAGWTAASLVAFFADLLLGGPTTATFTRRPR